MLVATGSIVESTQVWWSVRPHLAFGTVEVRICDAQGTAGESEELTKLIVACVLQAARDVSEGVPFRDPERRLIEENLWRAIRWGLDGRMIDFERGEEEPTRGAIERLLSWSAPVREEYGIEAALPELNGAQRQRARVADGATLQEAFAASVEETARTYAPAIDPEVQTP
jgi:carboxylate-amine ligase